jgi:DeoR/GlpR family transcriptional regulator of sugar metabolism
MEKFGMLKGRGEGADKAVSPRQAQVLDLLEEKGTLGLRDFVRILSSSRKSIQRDIFRLLSLGKIEKHGFGPSTRYERKRPL